MSPNKAWLMCSHRAGKTVIQAALAKGGNLKRECAAIGESDDVLAKVDRLSQIRKGRQWSNSFN